MKRPNYVKVQCLDEHMEPQELEGTEFVARAMLHEIDHLEGRMYVDLVEGKLMTTEEFEELNANAAAAAQAADEEENKNQ